MYLVLHSPTIDDLQRQATARLADGWLLAGGITTQIYHSRRELCTVSKNYVVPAATSNYDIYYLQAVYKPQPKDLL